MRIIICPQCKDEVAYGPCCLCRGRGEITVLEPGEVVVKRKDLVYILDYWNGAPESAVDAIEEAVICIEEIFSEADEVNDLECKIMELQEVIEKLEKRLKKVKDMMPQALKDQTDD